ncbi:MAG TPA: B12-binding domain-containing radical SAM protein [Polyangia bacterium]|nr:B12-binding domain-containing radical SAM protein [Polyangia bacterium]
MLLITPPLVQFNTLYPAVPMLAAFLQRHGYPAAQEDLSLGLTLRLYSPQGVKDVERALRRRFAGRRGPASVRHFLVHARAIHSAVADVVAFLQGQAPELQERLAQPGSLPEGPRFASLRGLFTSDDQAALARHRASLFLDEIADAVHDGLDDRFEMARYAEDLATTGDFESLRRALCGRRRLADRWIDQLAEAAWRCHQPRVVGVTVPFPGALYGALRIARRMKALDPRIATVLGGGFVNTELRELSDPRLFDDFDYVTYDDGEMPLLRIVQKAPLVRTRVRRRGCVVWLDDTTAPVLRHRDRPAPDFAPLSTHGYLAMAESPNPMHRLWSERRWLKLALAHGCYWHRCTFCDTCLDTIARFDPADAKTVVGWMEAAMAQTGERSFHFVDEAAPPALLASVARRILDRGLGVQWWTNIRFERQFTPALADLLARSGCLAVTGGLECATDRLLALLCKGFDSAQATRVMAAFARAGVLVHAYLMYGYPTQTAQETVDALELVRQLFAAGFLDSAYWHRFALTVHSPAFRQADQLGIRILDTPPTSFARNEVPFCEPGGEDPTPFAAGLRRAVYNFMHGEGLRADVRSWFEFPVPRAGLARDFVRAASSASRGIVAG